MKDLTGCKSPRKCFQKAKSLLDSLPPKWDPRSRQVEAYELASSDDLDDANVFKPHRVTQGPVTNSFRIFVEGEECNDVYHPENRQPTQEEITVVYTDGSAVKCGTEEAMAGAGVFYGENNVRNQSIHLPNEVGRTNQVSETVGAKTVAEDTPANDALELISDS
ncbi:hypothetical protein IW261DRAFT_1337230 [Armillaria novae-zelandiae]|uniref:RNase H type-1 domain-containing protein n=1 Tax=Armillaria novae-zelandiae TaxID=153914 RepID=A0AA39P7S0_9AGAR|nr:hypothetical protein IW261DRAFT_1337230 [Armillaria novae-zelandiae]